MPDSFLEFYNSLLELVKSFEKNNVMLKVEEDLEANIIRIFGQNITSIARAKTGLDEIFKRPNPPNPVTNSKNRA